MTEVVLVAAMGRNRVIGVDGGMPWHLPEDLRRFKELTMGSPMIMGRSTYDSIGRVLPGRTTIVLTRNSDLEIAGAIVAHTPEKALESARAIAGSEGEVMVVGGGEIYRLFLPLADRLELTIVDAEPKGDTTFPEIDAGDWNIVSSRRLDGDPGMTFETLARAR